ncbi:MAG: RNA polymerase sigma factor [Acidobacteria bacterium]|nr:RNA polymerase sigma factor [Acidobacteriota bacterium]
MRLCEIKNEQDDGVIQSHPDIQTARFIQHLTPIKKNLYNFILKSMNFSSDADDIYQETLLKSYRYFHTFDSNRNFKTWLFTIAHNQIKDYFKNNRVFIPLEEIQGRVAETCDAFPDEVRDIYRAAATLNPRQREVFFLYYYNEFKVTEIVDITGLTRFNVKFILHRARLAIKKMMEI